MILTDTETLPLDDFDTLAELDELCETIEDELTLTDGDAKPDGVTYELGVTCGEGLPLDVIDDDFEGYGVGVSEYHVDTDACGVDDTDAEELIELVELGEAELDNDGEPELDADNVGEIVNLLVKDSYGVYDASVLLVLEVD